MAKSVKQLSFDEFGRQFMERAVTPQLIGRSLAQIVPSQQQLTISAPAKVIVVARTELGAVERLPGDAPDRELCFAVPLRVHLALAVDLIVGHERYMALAQTRLRLSARTFAPLTIQIDCDPAEPGRITVASEGNGNWFDLAKRFGVLDDAIQEQVAAMINQHIHDSKHLRTIDVRKLIAHSADLIANGGRAAKPAKRSGRGAKAAPAEPNERSVGK